MVHVFDWGTANNNGNLNVATTSHGIPENPFLTYKDYYFYDSVNRISNVSGTDDHENLLWLENFQYDRYGNAWTPDMLRLGISGITPRTNVFTDGNQFSMGSYDAAGNQMVVGSYHLTYDAENRQTKVEDKGTLSWSNGSTFYQYDANGQRVAKARDTGLTIYVYDAFGKLTSEYTNFPMGAQPCTTCYLSQDHLGNTRLVTDEAGNTVARHDYRPFGEELIAGDGFRGAEWGKYDGVKQKFTGQEHDGETQFDFFHSRYLSGAQQRFMSADPGNAGANLFDPQSWNAYSYVGNNPLARIDPTGMSFVPCELPDSIACVGNDPPGKGDSGGGNDPFDPCFLCFLPRCILCIGFGGGAPAQEIPPPPTKFTVTVTANPANNGTNNNCVAGYGAAGAAAGAGLGWLGGGAAAVLGAETGPADIAIAYGGKVLSSAVGTYVGQQTGQLIGSIVCANRSGGGGSNFGDNQRQNKQANDARQAAERITGKRFTPAQERKFHDAITGQGLGYHDLVEIAVEVLEGRI
jgi:RHS repeat-associated protein